MFKIGTVLYYVSSYDDHYENIISFFPSELSEINEINPNFKESDEESIEVFLNNLPVGTVVCQELNDQGKTNYMICYPMITTHLSLPLKPGEIVWIYHDNFTPKFDQDQITNTLTLGVNHFWLSRKVGSAMSEDLNFSHLQRDTFINSEEKSKEFEQIQNPGEEPNVIQKKINALVKEEADFIAQHPDFEQDKAYKEKFGETLQNTNVLLSNSILNEDVLPSPVPRWNSQAHELTIQGSNNTIVNLTRSNNSFQEENFGGAIDIVAGRHSLHNVQPKDADDYVNINKIFLNKTITKDSLAFDTLLIDTSNPVMTLKNTLNYNEVLKDQLSYLREEIIDKEILSDAGNSSYKNDASRIFISESESYLDEDTSLFDNQFKNMIYVLNKDKEPFLSEYDHIIFKKQENTSDTNKIVLNNAASSLLIENNDNFISRPTVFIKSNDISIVARKKTKNIVENKEIPQGSIVLTKESDSFLDFAQFSLNGDGNIIVDAKTIVAGNVNKEYIRQEVFERFSKSAVVDFIIQKYSVEEEEANSLYSQYLEDKHEFFAENSEFLTHEKISHMHGKGNGLLIGYDQKFAEPLVLGNTLEKVITEILQINIEALQNISAAFNEISLNFQQINADHQALLNWATTHVHNIITPLPGNPVSPSTVPLQVVTSNPTDAIDASSQINGGEEIERLSNIINNLNIILSRFAKTT